MNENERSAADAAAILLQETADAADGPAMALASGVAHSGVGFNYADGGGDGEGGEHKGGGASARATRRRRFDTASGQSSP